MTMFKNVNVVSINVSDWARAKKFYTETLGWPVAFLSDEAGWMEFGKEGEAHVSIQPWRGEGALPKNGSTALVLSVDDAGKAVADLRKRGIKCDDVTVIPGMVAFAAFYDPDGNKIQFASPPPAA